MQMLRGKIELAVLQEPQVLVLPVEKRARSWANGRLRS